MYNVYVSKKYPVDINDSRNILATRIKNNYIAIETDSKCDLFYAVTSIDRYGNESLPTQQKQSDKSAITDKFIKNDGKKLLLPDKGKTLDSEYVIVKSLAGNIISIHPYKGKYADISNLENGCYILLSLNKKDIAHRLGYFMIKR